MLTKRIALLIHSLVTITVHAQLNTTDILQFVSKTDRAAISLQYPEFVKEFYKTYQYNSAWINNNLNRQQLFQLLKTASELGLQEEDYQFNFIQSFRNNLTILLSHNDSLFAEIRFTDAAIHFFRDVAFGNRKPVIGYNGLNYSPDCFNIPVLLAVAISENRFPLLLKELEPTLPGYIALKKLLILFNQRVNESSFKETVITAATANNKNLPLLSRLHQLGITDSLNAKYSETGLKEKVRSAQRLFNLPDDGVLHNTAIKAMNVPLTVRIEELKAAMNTLRWLRCISQQSPAFVVNIPSAILIVLRKGDILLQSKVIVGKRSTPTPTLTSKITDVVLYPYWVVPQKIATRELLPLIRRNIGYLDANNMQVLNMNGKVVNPVNIEWDKLSTSYFPYVLRQSTGCDNSLGLVKLNFNSPYGVYLHDTPWKVLFNFNKRYFSHGCIRVEKAIELAHFLLKENTIAIDTLEEKGCLRNQAPIVVPVSEKIPVFVLYNTAWIDSTALVQFNDDIYKKLSSTPKRP